MESSFSYIDQIGNLPVSDHRITIETLSRGMDHIIESDDDGVTLTINVPGYNDKLIDVSVSGDKLTIEGKSHTGSTEGFNHIFTINDNLDADEIDATAIDGVLTVSIPYAEAVKPRKIEVKVK